MSRSRPRGVAPLLALSAVVVLVVVGLSRGVWASNLHNGLLALACAGVGGYVLLQRPGHREGRLLLATGLVEAVVFAGRQAGHAPAPGDGPWWGWLGVWPVAAAIALVTLAVLHFPDGRLPSPRWRPVVWVVIGLAVVLSGLSALWPVEYAAAGISTPHPFALPGAAAAGTVWAAVAHPAYAALQLLWLVTVALRWRTAGRVARVQLGWVALAAAVSGVLLLVGLLVTGTPRWGLLATVLVPVAAGWAVVHGRHLAAYAALSWVSRAGSAPEELPTHLARAAAEALAAPSAAVWQGTPTRLVVAGHWPGAADERAVPLEDLQADAELLVRPVVRGGTVVGAVTVTRADDVPLAAAEETLLADLTAHAALVLGHVAQAATAPEPVPGAELAGLTPRERDVLALMARGFSNAAICAELHLSIKTVEPVVGAIFGKLGLPPGGESNRRVLAVRAYLGH